MKRNVETMDKIVRIIVGLVIIIFGIIYKNWLGVVGLIPLVTGLVGYCPLYNVCGVSICKKEKPEE